MKPVQQEQWATGLQNGDVEHPVLVDNPSFDASLRNEGITTVVLAGVSLNVAIPNAAFDLVNGGFQAVVATDCVVATPSEYGDQVLANTLSYVATLADSSELTASW